MSKKLNRFLKNLPSSGSLEDGKKSSLQGMDDGLVDDLFGVKISEDGDGSRHNMLRHGRQMSIKTKKKAIHEIPPKVLVIICEFLEQADLISIRLVSKFFHDPSTEVFRTVHNPILIDSDEKIFAFNQDMKNTPKFPFSRFRFVLAPITRHLLISFTRAYDPHVIQLWIEPHPKSVHGTDIAIPAQIPQQRLLHKLIAVLEELRAVENLEILFPALSPHDYCYLKFEKAFDLQNLKFLSIRFVTSGFCKFSADLTLEILKNTFELKKLMMKLPEPCNGFIESEELRRVLVDQVAKDVQSIALNLTIRSNDNELVPMLKDIVAVHEDLRVRNLILRIGPHMKDLKNIMRLLRASREKLFVLRMFRQVSPGMTPATLTPIRLPSLKALRFLEIESHHIPIMEIAAGQFPNLRELIIHLKYGNERFYQNSVLHPLEKLKIHFHETSILRMLVPESVLSNLISSDLKKLELVNPPPEHLTFMCYWGKSIETLIISAPNAYGEDPTYPIEKVLAQLRGSVQLRENFYNHLMMLPRLTKLQLLLPIDEAMAKFLILMPKLWELVVDDSLLSEKTIRKMQHQHHIYLSKQLPVPSSS